MSSELDFITQKSTWDIMEDMLNATSNTLDKREGSVIYDAILSMAVELSDFYTVRVPAMYKAFQILQATGEDLDNWAADLGLVRKGAEYTYYNVRITPNNIELVNGQRLTSHSTGVDWVYNGENVVRSINPGDYPETLNELLEPTTSYQGLESVVFSGMRSEGRDEETDDQLRARIIMALSTRVGGSVMDYAYIVLNQFKDTNDQRIPACLVFSVGRSRGNIDIYPANAAYRDVGEEHNLATMERWCTEEQCRALKQYIDPHNDQGYGYGLAPIGHLVYVNQGRYYDLQFKVYVVYRNTVGLTPIGSEDMITIYDVPEELKSEIENASLNYINTVIDRGMFTRENSTPERRGNRYRMLYISSEHVAALDAIKGNYQNVLGFQISYKKPGDEEWIEASDDFISIVNSHDDCKMPRMSALTVVGMMRPADWGEVEW